jgi:serine/threonine protein kinase
MTHMHLTTTMEPARGATTTPFDMVSEGGISRYHPCFEATRRATRLQALAPPFIAECNTMQNTHYAYRRANLEDMPEVRDWVWADNKTPDASCCDTQSDSALFVLKERYLVQQFIARGGMAIIYRGLDLQSNRTVALKILHETNNTPSMYVEYFLQEASITSLVRHPHIVQFYDRGQQNDLSFIVLEFIEGISLYQEMQTQHFLSVKRALTIAYAVALALGAAHDCTIVHQDVKPLNIMLGHNGDIKLIDFGIAKRYLEEQERAYVAKDIFLGTPQYLAPEQAQGFPISPATDVYALGVVLYEMLLGHRPFQISAPEIIAVQHIWIRPPAPKPLISPALEAVLLRCLEKEPEKRFQSGSELASALLVQLEDATECAFSPRPEDREAPSCDCDDDLITAPTSSEAAAGISLPRVLQIAAGICGFIMLIALSIYLTLYLL